ncbi:hypothetical protein PbJCM17693_46790 [Paenibacillus macerans]|nr:hypothetical protein PbJCM17693_46790 [Paenibacillus macerans]
MISINLFSRVDKSIVIYIAPKFYQYCLHSILTVNLLAPSATHYRIQSIIS